MTERARAAHASSRTSEEPKDASSAGEWEPKIIGFLCNWCSYAGADLCGVSRYQFPTNLRAVRVMCSTRIGPHLVLDLFEAGADGVLLGGCHIGDCHYITGNLHTEKRVRLMKKLMEDAGFDPNRLRLEWISASEGEKFSRVVTEFTEHIRKLGPSTVGRDPRLRTKVAAADAASETFRLRALLGKELYLEEKGNVYGIKLAKADIEKIIDQAALDEFERSLILELAKENPTSVKELANIMDAPADKILRHIVVLRQKNLIAMDHIEGLTPTYKTIEIGGEQ